MTIAQTKSARKKMVNDPRWKHKGRRDAKAQERKRKKQVAEQRAIAIRKAVSGKSRQKG